MKPQSCDQHRTNRSCSMENGEIADGERHFDGCNHCLCRNGEIFFPTVLKFLQRSDEELHLWEEMTRFCSLGSLFLQLDTLFNMFWVMEQTRTVYFFALDKNAHSVSLWTLTVHQNHADDNVKLKNTPFILQDFLALTKQSLCCFITSLSTRGVIRLFRGPLILITFIIIIIYFFLIFFFLIF